MRSSARTFQAEESASENGEFLKLIDKSLTIMVEDKAECCKATKFKARYQFVFYKFIIIIISWHLPVLTIKSGLNKC